MATHATEEKFNPADLIGFATRLFEAAGCDGDKPAVMAATLVEADLLGHTTHGLHLAAPYLRELANGAMTATGEPEVVADRPAAVTWDGRRLPGVWLTARGVDLAIERARQFGTATVVIRRSHHIACLAAFLQRATDHGMMVTVASSDPAGSSVAPYGGRKGIQFVFNQEGMRPALGCEWLVSRNLPDEVQKQFTYACVINMNGLPRFNIKDDGAGFHGDRIKSNGKADDLIRSTDKHFRPADPQIGPDPKFDLAGC